MNRRHVVSFASVFTPVAIGLTIGLAAHSAGATTTARTTPAAAPKLVLLACNNHPEIAPSGISSCADKTTGLRRVHWTSWTPQLASGYGTYVMRNQQKRLQSYPVVVALWGSAAVKGHPAEHKYARITLIFTGTPPTLSQVVNGKTVTAQPGTLTFPTMP